MIIICSGFPKSASTLLFLYTETLILNSSRPHGQTYFRSRNTERFVAHIGLKEALFMLYISLTRGAIAVKTHDGAGIFARMLILFGFAKGFYSLRDPRDVLLSALDHAEHGRKKTVPTASDIAFSGFFTRQDLYPALMMHFRRYQSWKKFGRCMFLRYETILNNEISTLKELCRYTGIKPVQKELSAIADDFIDNKKHTPNYNKGIKTRYLTEMSPLELREVELHLGHCIREMGYIITTDD